MDKTDRKILQVLQANARASLQDISQAVGLSATPCWGRIKKMEEAGVIEGYTIRLNPQAIGLGDTVLVQVTLDSHSDNTLEKFGETLAAIPEVIEAWLVSGEYDYLLRVAVKDTQGLRAPVARAAVPDQGHTPQQIQLCAAHPQEG
jgi:Lrp/AsnC family leucine-responsive transcriptional regulator